MPRKHKTSGNVGELSPACLQKCMYWAKRIHWARMHAKLYILDIPFMKIHANFHEAPPPPLIQTDVEMGTAELKMEKLETEINRK